MWPSTQENDQISSWTVRIAFISICIRAKWPYTEPDRKLTAEKQIPLAAPGGTEDDGLVWPEEDVATLPFRTLGSLRSRMPQEGGREIRQVGQCTGLCLNSEMYRDVTLNSTTPPLLCYSVYDRHSGKRHTATLPPFVSVMASSASQTTAVLHSSVLKLPLTYVLLNCVQGLCSEPGSQET